MIRDDVTLSGEVGRGKDPDSPNHAPASQLDGPQNGPSRDVTSARPGAAVLVVDDESCLRALLAELLEGAGYHVFVAENGAAALHLAQCERPTIVLTDYAMPGLDGPALIRHLRTQAATRHIPVIAMSATRPSREALGDVPFIAKPFDVAEVLETIARHTPGPPAMDAAQACPQAY
jgi:CheY-like chemotaxis protein